MWRTPNRQAPEIEFDYQKMKIKVDTRGLGKLAGTLQFSDLEKLPRVSHTFLMQCGAPNPRGIVTWTGVRFSDFADMLGLGPGVHYCRFVASDRMYVDEPLATLRHPQVMLAWLMNDAPIPPRHGAPLRLIVPFRYGQRSIKAITEIVFGTPGLPMPPLTA
jgi:DMSO/TMAO reductase YedYZ molybdopterin-dependent catalytic subunit